MLLEKENDFSENVILYKEMAEYYRETLFKEMKDCHRIKNQLQETAKNLEIKQSHDLNNFPKNTDLLGKYKLLLKQHQSDLKTKEIIIDKLRKDRKMLYLKISQIKKDVEDRKEEFEIEIQKLKSTVAGWKEKCSKLKDLKQIS
ncbi:unnamed protein product [Brassicogethes aeneus]|uniref:Uncharacterized protein n=1 Tax=Brassicogethes aeneus TaxID=1431903 RepID=A0A9P0BIA1_BRAAE|nr:unnamed protein product [Brassicogethes aeneus]